MSHSQNGITAEAPIVREHAPDTMLVTGGAGGIGLSIATDFASRGYRVAIADLDLRRAEHAVSQLAGAGHCAVVMDVSQEASVRSAFEKAEQLMGPLRVLVSNAGILISGDAGKRPQIVDMSVEDWDGTFAVNARGTFLCCKAFLALRSATSVAHARIITMSSVAAQLGGYRSSAAYIASKSAIIGLTKAVAREGAPLGITANTVAPGLINAPMLHQSANGASSEAASASTFALIPANRFGTSQEVASAVAYLASMDAAYVTGSVLDVNGGYRMQ